MSLIPIIATGCLTSHLERRHGGRVEWFKLASDEYRVILYTENNVKTYHRLIVSGSWSGDWVEK